MTTIELCNTASAAHRIGVSYAVLASAVYAGRIPAPSFRAGSVKLWTPEEVENARRILDERNRWLGRPARGTE